MSIGGPAKVEAEDDRDVDDRAESDEEAVEEVEDDDSDDNVDVGEIVGDKGVEDREVVGRGT